MCRGQADVERSRHSTRLSLSLSLSLHSRLTLNHRCGDVTGGQGTDESVHVEIWTSGLDINTKTTSMAAVRLNDVGLEFEQLVLSYWKIKLLVSFLKQVKCKLYNQAEK